MIIQEKKRMVIWTEVVAVGKRSGWIQDILGEGREEVSRLG